MACDEMRGGLSVTDETIKNVMKRDTMGII